MRFFSLVARMRDHVEMAAVHNEMSVKKYLMDEEERVKLGLEQMQAEQAEAERQIKELSEENGSLRDEVAQLRADCARVQAEIAKIEGRQARRAGKFGKRGGLMSRMQAKFGSSSSTQGGGEASGQQSSSPGFRQQRRAREWGAVSAKRAGGGGLGGGLGIQGATVKMGVKPKLERRISDPLAGRSPKKDPNRSRRARAGKAKYAVN